MAKKEKLLKLARECLNCSFNGKELEIPEDIKKEFSEKQACFVTLTKNGELRGCIGCFDTNQELWKNVIENARNAAFNDFRFLPLKEEELKNVKIEISILTPLKKLGIGKDVFDKIDNKMGIYLKKGFHSATFLPQVWEQILSKKEFLEHLSIKAGLEKDEWKNSELWYYRVEIIKE